MILIWNENSKECNVANHNQMIQTDEKPEMDFNFDSLYVKDEVAEKEMHGETYKLTLREKKLCLEYIRNFDFPAITVNVVGVDGFYKGQLPISEMTNGDIIVESIPPSFNYIYENEKWEKIILIIGEGGNVLPIMQGQRPQNIAIIFTDSNKPYRMPKEFEIWDFTNEKWKDTRDFGSEMHHLRSSIRQSYDTQVVFDIEMIHPNEMASYSLQLEEAEKYLKDSNVKTIFLDKLIETRDEKISKEDLAKKIIKKDLEFRNRLATMVGRQRNMLKKANKVKGLKELDTFTEDFQKLAFAGDI